IVLRTGMEADLVVLDPVAEPASIARVQRRGPGSAASCISAGADGLHVDRAIAAPSHPDPAAFPEELDAVGVFVADIHGRAVRITAPDVIRAVDVPEPLFRKERRGLDLHRPGKLGVHGPVGDVDMVRAPARDHPGAELLEAEPTRTAIPFPAG